MIPVKFLRKMGVYNLNLNGVTVEAKVVDNEELVKDGITELRNKLDPNFPIVGFDLKCTSDALEERFFYPKVLVLYVKDQCLLIQLGRMSAFPDSLLSFLRDQEICFLHLQDSRRLILSLEDEEVVPGRSVLKTGVDVGTFAARVLKNRELEDCTDLVELATKAGFPVKQQASQVAASQRPMKPLWSALCFTKEEVKYALKDAYDCYNLGIKLTSLL